MKENRKWHIVLLFLAGMLISVMIVFMRLGGGVNFEEFMSAGQVYDVKPSELKKSTPGWLYDSQNGVHQLLRKKSRIKYNLDEKPLAWNYLYITVEQLSTESVQGLLRYYGGRNKKILDQPITLTPGRNTIEMDGAVPVRKIGIVILDAKEEFISISQVQVRTTPSWFTIPHFLEMFAVVYAVVMIVLIALLFLRRKFGGRRRGRIVDVLFLSIQEGMKVFGDFLGSRMGGRLYAHQRESVRRFLFCLLFVWGMVGNAAGWVRNPQICRYHVLVCALLLLFISFVSWEGPLQNQFWNGPLMKSWLGIWLGVIFCELFVDRELESAAGYGMLISGTVFVYCWQNMDKPIRMLRNMMEALEYTFFLGIVYCMVFRVKRPAIEYNGMFRSPEELAMYGILMAVVFLTEMDWLIRGCVAPASDKASGYSKGKILASCVKNITGGALALFLILRSGHVLGIAVFILLGILYIPKMIIRIYGMAKRCRVLFLHLAVAAILAYMCVFFVFISTKYVPEILGMDMEYENETLLTWLGNEERKLYLMEYPGSLDGVLDKDAAKLPVIWRNYARRLNLFGHSGNLRIFHREVLPYNGYLDMAYHHGIFILLPYISFQVIMIGLGVKYAYRKRGRGNIYLLFLGIAWLCFSFGSSVEISWGHPLWLCYYLSVGCLGSLTVQSSQDAVKENLRKEGYM